MKTKYILVLSAVVFTSGVLLGLQLGRSEAVVASYPLTTNHLSPVLTETTAPPRTEPQSNPAPVVSTAVTTNSDEQDAQSRIHELEQQVANRDKELELMHQSLREVLALGSGDNSTTALTLTEAQALLPEPFAGLLAEHKGLVVDYLYEHQSEPVDTEWAYDLEQKVRDHFASHENAAKLKLSSVSCKTSLCEIRGFEYQPNAFTQVSSSLSAQRWWRFGRSYTLHGSGDNDGYFYLIAKKAP